jgi:hypothetical protein
VRCWLRRDYPTTALSTKDSFSFAAKLLREILTP